MAKLLPFPTGAQLDLRLAKNSLPDALGLRKREKAAGALNSMRGGSVLALQYGVVEDPRRSPKPESSTSQRLINELLRNPQSPGLLERIKDFNANSPDALRRARRGPA